MPGFCADGGPPATFFDPISNRYDRILSAENDVERLAIAAKTRPRGSSPTGRVATTVRAVGREIEQRDRIGSPIGDCGAFAVRCQGDGERPLADGCFRDDFARRQIYQRNGIGRAVGSNRPFSVLRDGEVGGRSIDSRFRRRIGSIGSGSRPQGQRGDEERAGVNRIERFRLRR